MNRTYTINGMTCDHCVKAITEEVSAIDGVDSVTVSLDSGSMTVDSAEEIDFDAIAAAVDEAGDYTVAKASSLDTAGHPGGQCGCGGHGHDHAPGAEERHAAHGEGQCGCGGHRDQAAEDEHAGHGCGCGGHQH